jgi:hypothetical protein
MKKKIKEIIDPDQEKDMDIQEKSLMLRLDFENQSKKAEIIEPQKHVTSSNIGIPILLDSNSSTKTNFTCYMINTKTYSEKTDICCWWCCHQFDSCPIPIPINYDIKTELFKVYGNFCSFSCAKTYLSTLREYGRVMSLLFFMKKKITKKIDSIISAPSRQALKIFGGILDIEDFRNVGDKEYTLVSYPFIPCNSNIEVKTKEKVNSVPKNSLKIARDSPSTSSKKGLSSLGIKTTKKK